MREFLKRHFEKIHEINQRYAKPRIKMTKGVRFALVFLKIYIFFLMGILVLKFITLLKG
jgi:hypothetical protein